MNRKEGSVTIPTLPLENGEILQGVELAYEWIGSDSNLPVILNCHALTGNHLAVGTEETPGWWSEVIGEKKAIDSRHFQVITFNVLGGCNGSTGPTSFNPATGKKYQQHFPSITIRDIVNAGKRALDLLNIERLYAVIGGSLGGMQVYEWGLLYPTFMKKLIILASTPYVSDYAIAFNHIGKSSIQLDPAWKGGEYEEDEEVRGLEIARMTGLVTYRSAKLYNDRFNRKEDHSSFEVETYLDYQGKKLRQRFDPNSYITLLEAMNSHDIGRGRGGVDQAGKLYEASLYLIGFTHDLLYPPEALKDFSQKVKADYYEVTTDYGHDGFLTGFREWSSLLSESLKQGKDSMILK
ncbi:homoserine acetyltransferase [Bacillus coahuilensis m2-6]|uniref:Homoserine O-acetyltransferase n=1 Tax=Bacillus coahuilensis p1.1.43 TaxID=1150625 RepID=A0A147K629_9BACI|nr:homoserine O-acetyltransferase [Bacillus coahuilensis]KUP05230.1 homoserine acetyltransferase [Bacillus coahuilensis p1.1.43]KUP05681.1 homoserine acetyltransferase [Bacillus coahuilensis m2-6]